MLLFVTIAVLLESARAKFYTDCGSNLATIQNVEVCGCKQDATVCVLKRNTNATVQIDFTPSTAVKSVTTEVFSIIMGISLPFKLSEPDACMDNGLMCPLTAGEEVKYTATLPILQSYPKLKVEVQWELINEDHERLVCILIPVKIK